MIDFNDGTCSVKRCCQAFTRALHMDGMSDFVLPCNNDLRSIKGAFVKYHVSKLTAHEDQQIQKGGAAVKVLTNKDKYKLGVEAWMNSTLRSVLNSSKGNGFAALPASMLL